MTEMKNRITANDYDSEHVKLSLVSNKSYNIANNIMKPLKIIHAELNKTYMIKGFFYENELYFKCIKAGRIIVKYRKGQGCDIILLSGKGILRIDINKTEKLKCQKK